jgi:hypothetical protein
MTALVFNDWYVDSRGFINSNKPATLVHEASGLRKLKLIS